MFLMAFKLSLFVIADPHNAIRREAVLFPAAHIFATVHRNLRGIK